jgi:hypothetical protein
MSNPKIFSRGTCSTCGDEGFDVLQVVQQHVEKYSFPAFYGFQFVRK